jgi:hypothetical protein
MALRGLFVVDLDPSDDCVHRRLLLSLVGGATLSRARRRLATDKRLYRAKRLM